MKKKILFLITLALFFSLNSCHKKEKNKESQNMAKETKTIRVNCQGPPSSFNQHEGVDLSCRNIQIALYEGLTRIYPDGKPHCAIADSFFISPDKLTYTFLLKKTKWTNYHPLTAYDFERSWKEALRPGSACMRSDIFYPIKNAQKAKENKISLEEVGVKAVDENTLVVTLEHPTPYFLNLLATPIFAPLYPVQEKEKPIGNGPFYVSLWEKDKVLELKKNPHYWDADAVAAETINITFVRDSNTVLLMFETNAIDLMGNPYTVIPFDAISSLKKENKLKNVPIAGLNIYHCNTEIFPLNNKKIRKALSSAINRCELISFVQLDQKPTYSFIPPCMHLKNHTYALETRDGAALLKEGLEELGITFQDFPTLTLSYPDRGLQSKIAEAVAQMWNKNLGIHVNLEMVEWNIFFRNLTTHQYQIAGCPIYCAYNDPSYILDFFREKTSVTNTTGWENAHYQKLLKRADEEIDEGKRNQILLEADSLLQEEMPMIPLFGESNHYLMNASIEDVYVTQLGNIDFRWAHFSEKP